MDPAGETVHCLEEDEFFDLEDFSGRGEIVAKVHTYQLHFNLAAPTRTKKTSARGRSSNGSLPVRHSNSACFRQGPWITTSTTPGGNDVGSFPRIGAIGLQDAAAKRGMDCFPI